jgi:AraC family transcriptional regulator of adaptative response / DNA-3-methyladenine glycosylase II
MRLELNRESFNRALDARDARFDGVFFVGVATTGIYCRPICPARRTLYRNRRFFTSAAAAERAGFRPCLRCRPELSPGRARVDAVPRLVAAAAERISAGALNGVSVDRLAAELGVSGRQLRRALQQELGVSPIELAQTRRLLLAKQLLTETRLSMSTVAHASGFQSLRRFNALFRERYRLNPEAIRRKVNGNGTRRIGAIASQEMLRLSLSYRPPIDWAALIGFLAPRATPGVEHVEHGRYSRTVKLGEHTGVIRAWHEPAARPDPAVRLEISASLLPVLMLLSARVRQLFDLDCEPAAIEMHLRTTGFDALDSGRNGLRVPGAFDGFELVLRAILGQQVTVKGATTLSARLTSAFGETVDTGVPGLTRLTPTADRIAQASVASIRDIGLPVARASTIHRLARAVADGSLRIAADANVRNVISQLTSLPGIGPWTAEYVAMRALHWPDAFPAGDLALRKAMGGVTEGRLRKLAEPWRPWRSYAAMHLWMSVAQTRGAVSRTARALPA